MAYTNTTLIGNYLQRSLNANETAYLAVMIPAIKIWIDKLLNSTFDSVAETTRYFDGGGTSVDIDPCIDITDVDSVDNEQLESFDYTNLTDYIAEPQNETVKRELVKRSGHWPAGYGRIKVTAKFTEFDGSVPEDIQTVATILAADVLNQGVVASTGGNVQSESLEGHSISYDTSSSNLDAVASNNPTITSLLGLRRELFVG